MRGRGYSQTWQHRVYIYVAVIGATHTAIERERGERGERERQEGKNGMLLLLLFPRPLVLHARPITRLSSPSAKPQINRRCCRRHPVRVCGLRERERERERGEQNFHITFLFCCFKVRGGFFCPPALLFASIISSSSSFYI